MSLPTADLDDLRARLAACSLADRRTIARRIDGVGRALRAGRDVSHALEAVTLAVDESVAARERRLSARPTPAFDLDLPILERREAIAEAIDANPVVVICGETGSGKTTQLPQICLALGRGVDGRIGHTQPRRIAARSVATRIADELGVPLGESVGYQVRFEKHTGPDTHIKLMTDGILLAETQGDPLLEQYDTIIVDEAHERGLNVDFLLGYLKQLLTHRDDLKVIVTSATIDPERFSQHFDGAPIIEVSGRTYPVEVRYRPMAEDADPVSALREAVVECTAEGAGDVLVFLPSERDIRDAADALGRHNQDIDVLPLFGRLSVKDQMRVFTPSKRRRVVLATNVAETSITVPGIRFVVDTGLARISRYSTNGRVQRLPVEKVSRASAIQRSGRCGRVAAGVAIRLYDERDFERRDEYTQPEVLRSNLAGVILRMKALGLGEVEAFPFVDPPHHGRIRDGYLTLFELDAVDAEGELTETGHALTRLPVDPRLGRMLLEADQLGCVSEALVVVAALSIQDPRERPFEAREDADKVHAQFAHPESDVLTWLRLWKRYLEQAETLGSSRLRRWCRDHYLAAGRMREWRDVHRQLRTLTAEAGLTRNASDAPIMRIHRAVLAGLLSNIGSRVDKGAYRGAHGTRFWLWPGSVLVRARPRWVVVAERVETSRLFGRIAAPIDPAWIEPLAGHLVERTWYDPHWNEVKAHVYAYERVALFGVEIVQKHRVHFAPLHPPRAREIFIRHALVQGRFRTRARFFRHNRELLEHITDIEARTRRGGLLAGADDRFAYYDERVPADVNSGPTFERWLREARKTDPRVLMMDAADLLLEPGVAPDAERFPDSMEVGGVAFPLTYRYEPGHPDDGVTLTVPIDVLAQVDASRLDWLVPGRLLEKVTALLRALPKSRRRILVPVSNTAEQVLTRLDFGRGSLYEALSAAIESLGHGRLPVTVWAPEGLPAHLFLNVAVVSETGERIDQDRDVRALSTRQLATREAAIEAQARTELEVSGLVTWSIGKLPERVAVSRKGYVVGAYPALHDDGESASVVLEDTPERAADTHLRGVRRLLAIALRKNVDSILSGVRNLDALAMTYGTLGDPTPLRRALADRIVSRAAGLEQQPVRMGEAFEATVQYARGRLAGAAQFVVPLVRKILDRYHALAIRLMLDPPVEFAPSVKDMIAQLGLLLAPDFVRDTPETWFAELPRYLEALRARLRKVGEGGLAKDRRHMETIAPHWLRYRKRAAELHAQGAAPDAELERYRWWIEELRVSLFAQELGTSVPISAKRLDAQWQRAVFGTG